MFKAKTAYKQLMFLMEKATIIQTSFRRYLEVKNTRKAAANKFKEKMLE